jgi:indole-3-glycerol phosphate synthase
VRALEPSLLTRLVSHAAAQRVETLVEVRSEQELDRALALPVSVIGVNSRNLETLELDPAVSARLIPLIPADRIAVAESGIRSREDASAAALLGADALLVGSSISASSDPEATVRSLADTPRVGRARSD